jgi:spore coat protein A, manganese oxidase
MKSRLIGRRDFLRQGLLAGASVSLGLNQYCRRGSLAFLANPQSHHLVPQVYTRALLDPNRLARFVDPLPIMPSATPSGTHIDPEGNLSPIYQMQMTQFLHTVNSALPPTTVWGFNGSVPGPTFEIESGSAILVNWVNALPSTHMFSIDPTIHGAETTNPPVRTVVHLHGAKVQPDSDGFPEDWFTPGNSALYFYPNQQQATTLWYHDHALGIVRLNNYAGLSGIYIIHDSIEQGLGLPAGIYDIPLVIQDRSFDQNGQLNYPTSGRPGNPWIPEFFGNTIMVNGCAFPYLAVEPRRYRFRILNASNARFYNLALSSGAPFYVIGTDQGLLPAPVAVGQVLIAPSERIDVVLDFTAFSGKQVIVTNDALAPYPSGGMIVPNQVMQFQVGTSTIGKDTSVIPPTLAPFTPLDPSAAVNTRTLRLVELDDGLGYPLVSLLNYQYWSETVTENPVINTVEVWNLINETGDAHPIHIHLIKFQIISRQPFNQAVFESTSTIVFTGPPVPPPAWEAGWKDVVRADPGFVNTIIAKFEGYTGKYVWHCHILEHEDNEMMRPYEVIAAPATAGAKANGAATGGADTGKVPPDRG